MSRSCTLTTSGRWKATVVVSKTKCPCLKYKFRITVPNSRTSAKTFVASRFRKTLSKKHLEQRVEDLTKFSESNKEKLAVYERHGPAASSGSGEEVSREQQLEAELAETSAKLKMAERALEKAKDRVLQYEGMSQAAEEALSQVQATLDEYKISTESTITQRDATIKSLEEKLVAAQTDLGRATEAMKEAQKTLDTEKSNWFKDKAELEGTIVDLSISGKSSESDKSAREAEVQQLRDRTKAAEERYQSEVMAHAEAIKANTTIREELTELRSKSQENIVAADTASRKLLDSEKSWALQKENLEKEIAEHDRRFKDLQAQNKTLFQQFDDLAKSTERVRQGATEIPEGEEASPEMAAVHNYLRGQNQYLEVQLDAKNAETARLKTRCDHLTHEVDEVRTMLAQEREKAVENSQSASEHKELVDRINQMNILRESNSTLRSDSERHAKRVKQLEVQLKEATAALDPVKEQARVAEAEVDATKKLLAKVEEQSKIWHDRLLAKNNGAADIPALQEEITKLKETNVALEAKVTEVEKDLEAVRGENSKLKERFAKFLDAHKRYKETSERLQKVVDGYAEEKAAFEAAKAAVVAEKEALEAKVVALDEEIEKLKTTPTISTEQHTKATDLVRHNIDLMDKAKQSTAEIEELRKEKEAWEQEKAQLGATGDSGDIEKEREQWQKEKAALIEAAAAGGDEASKILLEAEREAHQNEKDALQKQKDALEKEKDAAVTKINELQAKFDELTEEHNANSKALGVFTATKNKELAALREKAVKDQEAAIQVALTKLRAELGNSDALAAANKKHAEELSTLTAQHKQDVEAAKAAAPSTSTSSQPAPNSPEYEKALEEARAAGKKELEMKVRLQENRASRLTKQVQVMEKKIMRWVADGVLSQEVVDTKIPEIEDAPSQPLQPAASTISASPATPSTSAAPSTLPTKPLPDAALGTAAPATRGRGRGRGGAATSASARGAAPPNASASATRGGAAAAIRGAAAAGRGAQRGRGRGGAAAPTTGLSIQGAAAQKRPREEGGGPDDQQAKKPRPTPGAGS
ncbi:hypothetical protein CYLTODRAFT_211213 [Cylindrobasidium torrendii FP15055 ss-10]|uniref:Nucleoprotein TPR/MLP1-2 domain-containing protein n=1 Tax=Cylindrobasidium torrendii FP15055 ss-10 TaxID=1314674 RepID=A0A0D7BH20_9AGAR|nr:hypothetical protein CYLTODRAFT_211213 [Cylindrobasidium torrendii FP15055 ss-10]